MKILIVDDDLDMMMITERWLTKAGYEVSRAASGQEAVDILKKEDFDLVLLDYSMPDMDGKDTLIAIRKDNEDVKVLFRTGIDDVDIEEVVNDYHANGYVSKSEGKPKLMAAIDKLLN